MTATLTRISPGAKHIPTVHWFRCERCDRPITANGIGLACLGCTEAARALWPHAPAVLGQISGS